MSLIILLHSKPIFANSSIFGFFKTGKLICFLLIGLLCKLILFFLFEIFLSEFFIVLSKIPSISSNEFGFVIEQKLHDPFLINLTPIPPVSYTHLTLPTIRSV